MKTIGLIGGMSFESTITYYRIINTAIKDILGGFHSAKCLLYSVDFSEIEECQTNGDWERCGDILSKAALSLKAGGADFIVICTNTMHKVAENVEKSSGLPLLHIGEVTAGALKAAGIKKCALLGTRYTMEQDFYKEKLKKAGIQTIIPEVKDREIINSVIYNELCKGVISEDSKKEFLRIINGLSLSGAEGIILGCTEIGLLVNKEDTDIPLFDTALIHAAAAAREALKD